MAPLPVARSCSGRRLWLAALAATAALRLASPPLALGWVGALSARGPSAAAPRHGFASAQRPGAGAVARRAGGPDRKKLEEEAMATENFFRSVTNFFNPRPQGPTEEEIQVAERRKALSAATKKALERLKVSVVAGVDNEGNAIRRSAPISVLQNQARQNLAIFGTTSEEGITDLLLSMRISASQFAERNILVVPVLVNLDTKVLLELSDEILDSKLMKQGAVALPDPKNDEEVREWGLMMAKEFVEAWDQGMGPQAEIQGLGLLLKRDGEIVRRGVGRPEWQAIFSDLGL
mmetsp:Transcript_10301/g.32497  ORF Transcript_10301/g.32497 Transcript_10301/m.32497 type:complete len:291 (+) Transcript_10301:90-962(+)